MSTERTPIERVTPMTGAPKDRKYTEDHAAEMEAAETGASIGIAEIHTTIDEAGKARVFVGHRSAAPRFLGNVADESAMLALHTPASGLFVFEEDTCYREDAACEYRCITLAADVPTWQPSSVAGLTTVVDETDDDFALLLGTGVSVTDESDDDFALTLP